MRRCCWDFLSVHTCAYSCVCICVCMYACICACIWIECVCLWICKYVSVRVYARVLVHVCGCVCQREYPLAVSVCVLKGSDEHVKRCMSEDVQHTFDCALDKSSIYIHQFKRVWEIRNVHVERSVSQTCDPIICTLDHFWVCICISDVSGVPFWIRRHQIFVFSCLFPDFVIFWILAMLSRALRNRKFGNSDVM